MRISLFSRRFNRRRHVRHWRLAGQKDFGESQTIEAIRQNAPMGGHRGFSVHPPGVALLSLLSPHLKLQIRIPLGIAQH